MSKEILYKNNSIEGQQTTIPCPECGSFLYVVEEESTAPDDFINWLVCEHCGYKEKE